MGITGAHFLTPVRAPHVPIKGHPSFTKTIFLLSVWSVWQHPRLMTYNKAVTGFLIPLPKVVVGEFLSWLQFAAPHLLETKRMHCLVHLDFSNLLELSITADNLVWLGIGEKGVDGPNNHIPLLDTNRRPKVPLMSFCSWILPLPPNLSFLPWPHPPILTILVRY